MAGKRIKVGKFRGAVPAPALARVTVKVGRLKAESRAVNMSRGARKCTVCKGHRYQGNWVHDLDCIETIVQYNADTIRSRSNIRGGVWPCPFKCKPTPLSFGRTHHWECPFWESRLDAHPL